VKILYFSWVRDRTGLGKEDITLPENVTTVEQLATARVMATVKPLPTFPSSALRLIRSTLSWITQLWPMMKLPSSHR
jgi:hypothetical protein